MLLNHDEEFIRDCRMLNEIWERMKKRGALGIDNSFAENAVELQFCETVDFDGDIFERDDDRFPFEKVAGINGVKVFTILSASEVE